MTLFGFTDNFLFGLTDNFRFGLTDNFRFGLSDNLYLGIGKLKYLADQSEEYQHAQPTGCKVPPSTNQNERFIHF